MKGKPGDRVRNTTDRGNLRRGLEGYIHGPGDQSIVFYKGERDEEREKRLELFTRSYTRICWDGYAFPFNHPDDDFEHISTPIFKDL